MGWLLEFIYGVILCGRTRVNECLSLPTVMSLHLSVDDFMTRIEPIYRFPVSFVYHITKLSCKATRSSEQTELLGTRHKNISLGCNPQEIKRTTGAPDSSTCAPSLSNKTQMATLR